MHPIRPYHLPLKLTLVYRTPLCRRCEIESEVVDRCSVERLSATSNRFEKQGQQIWKAGVGGTQHGHSDGWLGAPLSYMHLPCMFEHMKKVNPDAAGAPAEGTSSAAQPSSAADAILVQDSIEPADELAEHAAPVLLPSVPTNKFERSLTAAPWKSSKAAPKPTAAGGFAQGSPTSYRPSPTDTELAETLDAVDATSLASEEDSQLGVVGTSSRDKLESLKSKLPLQALMGGAKLGRQERTVRLALQGKSLDDGDKKLLRNHLKLAPNILHDVARHIVIVVSLHRSQYKSMSLLCHPCLLSLLISIPCRSRPPSSSPQRASPACPKTRCSAA